MNIYIKGDFILNKRSIYADLSLLIVAFVWGAGFVASKEALNFAKPFYVMTIRFALSFILMSLFFYKKIKNISLEDIKNGSVIGIFLFLAFAAQTVGLQYTSAGKQAFLTGTNVVIVPFLYWLLTKKRPDIYSIGSAFLCVLGIALLTLQGTSIVINIGDSLTLLCALFFAAHIVSVGHYTKKSDPIILTVVQFFAATIFSLIVAIFFEPTPTHINMRGFFALGYLGIFSTLVAFLIQNLAQKHTSSTHAAIILCTESVFGSILSMIFLKETFTLNMVLGCIIIFFSIIMSETKFDFLKNKKK